ncbi:peptidylprolyl isomerase [Paraclostridium bifermentans]|uniref:Peptidylprolyl isomerase n=1 Tax=Paraclostridium bifermentans TaxID=1490 RepID=A0AA44DN93_PARBF|nr:peptidylprolyl isomerase [Paraclostridium bifermentans]MBN8049257.1 peptidylprolyl isomerase [Paraclostridium bifermentans]NME10862.1 peptidylprolyl isomerase [Paraclostridium bifermentans]
MKKIISLIMVVLLGVAMTACGSEKPVAVVNGVEITASDYKKTVETYKESISKMYGKDLWNQEIKEGVKYKDEMKKAILQQMVQEQVIYQQAKKDKLEAKQSEVDKQFKQLKESVKQDKDYEKFLKDNGIDDEFLKAQLEKDITIQNFKNNFDKNTKISEAEMKKYYEENKNNYVDDEVRASHILISTVDQKTNKPLSEEKQKEAKKKADDLYEKVKSGGDFAKLAKENSDDKGSAAKGGDLGFFSKGQMVPEFEKAAFAMDKGDISNVVKTQYGYHIIKVTDKKYKEYTFDEVKDNIKQNLLYQKYTEKVKQLTDKADVETNEKEALKINI